MIYHKVNESPHQWLNSISTVKNNSWEDAPNIILGVTKLLANFISMVPFATTKSEDALAFATCHYPIELLNNYFQ